MRGLIDTLIPHQKFAKSRSVVHFDAVAISVTLDLRNALGFSLQPGLKDFYFAPPTLGIYLECRTEKSLTR